MRQLVKRDSAASARALGVGPYSLVLRQRCVALGAHGVVLDHCGFARDPLCIPFGCRCILLGGQRGSDIGGLNGQRRREITLRQRRRVPLGVCSVAAGAGDAKLGVRIVARSRQSTTLSSRRAKGYCRRVTLSGRSITLSLLIVALNDQSATLGPCVVLREAVGSLKTALKRRSVVS